MFELLKAKRQIALTEARQAVLLQKIYERLLSPNRAQRKTLEDIDESDWTILGTSPKELDASEAGELREVAMEFFYRNSHARNILRLMEKYIVGRGFDVQPISQNPMVKRWLDTFWRVNRMDLRKKEVVRRTMRDGEAFIRFFPDQTGMLLTRFMDAGKVTEPKDKKAKNNVTYGIETNPDDVEDVLAYWYKEERVPAEDVQHIKIMVDSDVKRGRSYLEAMLPDLKMYKDWLRDRMKLNKVRATIALVKQITGTGDQIASLVNAQKTLKRKASDNTEYAKAPEGVSVLTTSKGVDYKMLSPNLQAADVQEDGRSILLAISAGAGLPEFMVTSDSSNSNYASTLVAEAPGVREFMDWQDFFSVHFKEILAKVITAGIKAGEIPAKEEITIELEAEDPETGERRPVEVQAFEETSTEVEITFPELIHREIEKETKAYVLQSNQRWISNRTAASRLDLDYDYEMEQLKQEEEEMATEQEGDSDEERGDEEYLKARSKAQQTPEDEEDPETEKAE